MLIPLVQPIVNLNSPNFTPGRNGQTIRGIVVHKGEGSIDAIISTFKDPASQRSSHYVIGYAGNVVQMVDTDDTAWHTGLVSWPTWKLLDPAVNPNEYTVGIELEGYAANGTPPQQLTSLAIAIAEIANEYDLSINADTIVFHREIDNQKECPGFNINKDLLILLAADTLAQMKGGKLPVTA